MLSGVSGYSLECRAAAPARVVGLEDLVGLPGYTPCDLAKQIFSASNPYNMINQFAGDTADALIIGDYAGSMYCLRGALSDWVELKPEEEDLAFAEMVRVVRDHRRAAPTDPRSTSACGNRGAVLVRRQAGDGN